MANQHPQDIFEEWQQHEILKGRQTRPPVQIDIIDTYTGPEDLYKESFTPMSEEQLREYYGP